jgi:hypothetical protein
VCGIRPAFRAASMTGREQPINLANSLGIKGRVSEVSIITPIGYCEVFYFPIEI